MSLYEYVYVNSYSFIFFIPSLLCGLYVSLLCLNARSCLLLYTWPPFNLFFAELMSESEYAAFKAKAIAARSPAHRIYVVWRNRTTLVDCRNIGPSSPCFCTHRYRDHATDNTSKMNVHCRMAGCKCALFDYIPIHGSQDAKCNCKHSYTEHNGKNKKCSVVNI